MKKIMTGLLIVVLATVLPHAGRTEEKIQGRPVSQWVTQLRSDNRGLQLRASRALATVPQESVAAVAPKVMPLLKSERENDKFVAAQVLGEYGPAARDAVPDLLPMLQGTQHERNRAAAAKALGQILKDAEPSPEIERIAEALAAKFNEDYDKYSDVRREAVYALGMIGPAAKNIVPKLTRGLTDYRKFSREHFMVRQASAWTAGRMGPHAAEHIDRLISMLHAEGYQAPEIVEAIGRIGPVHENVVPNIMDAMEVAGGRSIGNQIQSYRALEACGPKAAPAVPLLARFLREQAVTPPLAVATLRVLKSIGPMAKDAMPAIETYYDIQAYRGRKARANEAQLNDMRRMARLATQAITGQAPAETKE